MNCTDAPIRAHRAESTGIKLPAPKSWIDTVPSTMIDECTPELQDWMAEGRALVQAYSGHQWAIADWMLRGESRIGQRAAYDYAEKATGYSRKTLIEWAYVARHLSIRMDNLSFGHHQAVAMLLPETQKRCLEHAAATELSVLELREKARWEPHRLIDPESQGEEASLLLRFRKRAELDLIEVVARGRGLTSDEDNSAVGRLIYLIIREYLEEHQELRSSAAAELKALAQQEAQEAVA
jgi:hypothetical protein